jgi:hypothetical protein
MKMPTAASGSSEPMAIRSVSRGIRLYVPSNSCGALGWQQIGSAPPPAWGVEKPSAGFFEPMPQHCGCPAAQIAYVGDRLDNDVRPALAAGMLAVFIRRGPWGYLGAADPDVASASIRIDSLSDYLNG